jgi:superfamily II DNA helicase RecQ
MPILAECAAQVTPIMSVSVDNSEVKKTLSEASAELLPELALRIQSMKSILESGFSIESFLRIRNDIMLSTASELKKKKQKTAAAATEKAVKTKPDISEIYASNRHPELIEPLTEWRTEKYMEQNIRAYWVLTQRTLLEIADTCPTTKEELLAVNGFGPAKWKQYGEEILELVARFRK